MFKVNDSVFFISNNKVVVPATVIKVSGGFVTVKYASSGNAEFAAIRLRESKFFRTKQEAYLSIGIDVNLDTMWIIENSVDFHKSITYYDWATLKKAMYLVGKLDGTDCYCVRNVMWQERGLKYIPLLQYHRGMNETILRVVASRCSDGTVRRNTKMFTEYNRITSIKDQKVNRNEGTSTSNGK